MSEEKKLKGKECRFVTYVRSPDYDQPDLHVAKVIKHYEDGTSEPAVELIYDFKRPYWVVKKGARNYEQPKEWIDEHLTFKQEVPQRNLIDAAKKSLSMPWFQGSLRMLHKNPYLFGTDIKSTAVLKKAYADRYPGFQTPFSIAFLDSETDVIHGHEEIIMLTLYYRNQCITAVTEDAVKRYHDVQTKVKTLMRKYLGEYIDKYNIEEELIICPSEIDVIKAIFEKAHELKPDFMAIWNLDFDVTKLITACEKAMVEPKFIFSDPSIPDSYKYFDYVRGPSQKVTSSGKITPIPPAARWHTVRCPASFYFIDSMCAYKHTRIGKPEKPSYALDAILGDELNLGKLNFTEAGGYERLKWHQFMQENYMLEYIIYNRFDCIGMALLEEKNKDLSVFLPLFSGTSDFEDFKSQPRRTVDQLHWFVLERGKVMGTTNKEMGDEYNDDVVGLEDWISNLAASLITPQGLKIIDENPHIDTTVYSNVGD